MRTVFGMRSPYGSPCTYSYLRFIFIHILYKYLFHIIHGSCVLCQNKKKKTYKKNTPDKNYIWKKYAKRKHRNVVVALNGCECLMCANAHTDVGQNHSSVCSCGCGCVCADDVAGLC